VQQKVTIVKPDLPARFANFFILPTYDFKLERYAKSTNFYNVLVTNHGAQTSDAQRPQVNARLYTAYWSRGMAERDG